MEFPFDQEAIRSDPAAFLLREEVAAPPVLAEPTSVGDDDAPLGPLGEDDGTLAESGGSVIRPDGTVKLAIIRPCISRGKRVRDLPPIYTPSMLEANHKVFEGWVMFADHLMEQVQESLTEPVREAARKARGIRELGGRIVRTEWDPDYTHPDDSTYGHEPGAVIGYAIPQPFIREMLEADPEILRVSINAYPSGVREGVHRGRKGALIEGISPVPEGSVDWVIRAGAGGRVLREDEALAVSVLEGFYDAPTPGSVTEETYEMDLKNTPTDELISALREQRPGLLESEIERALQESRDGGGPVSINLEDVTALLQEQEERITARMSQALGERDAEFEDRVEQMVEERESDRSLRVDLSAYAHQLIESAEGLTPGWKSEIKSRFSVLPSGPSAYLLVEDDEEGSARDKVRALVEDDVERALELIRESRPDATVTGQGGGGGESEAKPKPQRDNDFVSFLQESGNYKTPEDALEALREGIS